MKSKAVLQRLGFLADLVGRPLPGVRPGRPVRAHTRAATALISGDPNARDGDIGYVAPGACTSIARGSDLLAEVPRLLAEER